MSAFGSNEVHSRTTEAARITSHATGAAPSYIGVFRTTFSTLASLHGELRQMLLRRYMSRSHLGKPLLHLLKGTARL